MTQPLNFTTKAIECLSTLTMSAQPESARGMKFLVEMLQAAEVFVLPNNGVLLDRSKARPDLAGTQLRPPFSVVALEYVNDGKSKSPLHETYGTSPTSRNIVLAWQWTASGPNGFSNEPGDSCVVIASIAYYDDRQLWMPVPAGLEISVDGPEAGVVQADTGPRVYVNAIWPLLPEALDEIVRQIGKQATGDLITADLSEEMACYLDFCTVLSCTNVAFERSPAPEHLNRQRIKAGKRPLKDFHTITIPGRAGATHSTGEGSGGVRSHLRRGHIRRLGPERITWVNSCIVRGSRSGFVEKQYAVAAGSE